MYILGESVQTYSWDVFGGLNRPKKVRNKKFGERNAEKTPKSIISQKKVPKQVQKKIKKQGISFENHQDRSHDHSKSLQTTQNRSHDHSKPLKTSCIQNQLYSEPVVFRTSCIQNRLSSEPAIIEKRNRNQYSKVFKTN